MRCAWFCIVFIIFTFDVCFSSKQEYTLDSESKKIDLENWLVKHNILGYCNEVTKNALIELIGCDSVFKCISMWGVERDELLPSHSLPLGTVKLLQEAAQKTKLDIFHQWLSNNNLLAYKDVFYVSGIRSLEDIFRDLLNPSVSAVKEEQFSDVDYENWIMSVASFPITEKRYKHLTLHLLEQILNQENNTSWTTTACVVLMTLFIVCALPDKESNAR